MLHKRVKLCEPPLTVYAAPLAFMGVNEVPLAVVSLVQGERGAGEGPLPFGDVAVGKPALPAQVDSP